MTTAKQRLGHETRLRVRSLVVLLSTLILAIALFMPGQHAVAAGVDTHEGFAESAADAIGVTTAYIDQRRVRDQALVEIQKWRRDALNDTRVKWPNPMDPNGQTMRQYLASNGISESSYLNPKWDYRAERIAIQRAVEAVNSAMGHDRFTENRWITFDGLRQPTEVLAWGRSMSASGAINLWASEKVFAVNRTPGVIGHWTYLIDPRYTAYGIAGAADGRRGWTWAGTAYDPSRPGASYQENYNMGTGWFGWLSFKIPIGKTYFDNATPSAWELTLQQGETKRFNWIQSLPGNWRQDLNVAYAGALTSGDENIATVRGDQVTGRQVGTTYLRFVSGAMDRYVQVKVIPERIDANMTWLVRDDDIAIGASPSNQKFSKYEYRWQTYRVNTDTWTTISDWSAGNWSSWAQDKGTYWLHLDIRDKTTKDLVAENTIAFAHTPGKYGITGTYAGTQADGTVLLGVDSSNPRGRYVTKIYDVQRKTWVAQFPGHWNTWRPSPGIYWTHYELYTPEGRLQDVRTYPFQMR